MAEPAPDPWGEARFLPCGDTGLTVQLGDVIDRPTSARVQAMARAIEAAELQGVIEVVPAYVSLTVHFDPLRIAPAELAPAIKALTIDDAAQSPSTARRWVAPVCFDAAFAPDLPHLADWAGISQAEAIADMTSVDQFVYMLGFAPGQPYMGDLPERLAIPRRETPLQSIPAGSVVVATGKTIIYPASNPTGWRVVGRTPISVFDLSRAQPALFAPGDLVRLRRVERDEYDDIRARTAAGAYTLESEALA